jgi:peptidoglycan/LPS O-acetylase OafA/YrhL
LGFLRLYLALCVARYHAIPLPFDGFFVFDGPQAVQFFYVLSGFYITMVLCTSYDVPGGTRVFYLKRFLRILPMYWLSLAVIGVLAAWTGWVITFQMAVPPGEFVGWLGEHVGSWVLVGLSNALLIASDVLWYVRIDPMGIHWAPFSLVTDYHNGSSFSLNAPAFTLAVELYFYLMAPFIVKKPGRVWVFFTLGFCYLLGLMLAGEWEGIWSYLLFPATWMYFGLGAFLFHWMRGSLRSRTLAMGMAGYALVFAAVYSQLPEDVRQQLPIRYWAIIAVAAWGIPRLFQWTKRSRADRFLGDMSYTVYVFHYPLVSYAAGSFMEGQMLAWLLAISACITLCIEQPLERMRARISVRS